jgi:NAD(P)-dependent dehydrogenase (short-subunit alcohol dehydrogenase family)
MLLHNKTAVISGAASPRGIGFATARLFAQHGARVAIVDLDEAGAQRAAKELGDAHIGIACNVAERQSCQGAARQVIATFGGIDILVNNAGVTQPVKTMDITEADWRRIVDVNMILPEPSLYPAHARAQERQHRPHVLRLGAARGRHLRRPSLLGG